MNKTLAIMIVIFLIILGAAIGLSPFLDEFRNRTYKCGMVGAEYDIIASKCFLGGREVKVKF